MKVPDRAPEHVVLQEARLARIADIQNGFCGAVPRRTYFNQIRLRFFGRSPDESYIARAARSANRPARYAVTRELKRLFLLGQFRWCDAFLARHSDAVLFVWNGIKGHRSLMAHAAKLRGVPVVYFEESPLPGRVTIDTEGVNFGSSIPRRPDFYRAWAEQSGVPTAAWRALCAEIRPRPPINGTSVRHDDAGADLGREPYLFVPLQVPGDSQLTIYGDWMRSLETFVDFLDRAADALPQGWHIRVKEHPSARVSLGECLRKIARDRLRIDNSVNTMQQVERSRGVLTINSSVGLQAFFYNKPVIVLGQSYYNIEGVVQHAANEQHALELLSDPEAFGFDADLRAAFMNYLDREYYPREMDVIAGRFSFPELAARDARREAILGALGTRDKVDMNSA